MKHKTHSLPHAVRSLFLGLTLLILTGCNPQNLFSRMATNQNEQASSEAIEQAETQQLILAEIKAKQDNFPEYSILTPVTDNLATDSAVIVAYRNDHAIDGQSLLDIQALVKPPAGEAHYTFWLQNSEANELKRIGKLEHQEYNHYQLIHETPDDLSGYPEALLSLENTENDDPEKIMAAGRFVSNKESQ